MDRQTEQEFGLCLCLTGGQKTPVVKSRTTLADAQGRSAAANGRPSPEQSLSVCDVRRIVSPTNLIFVPAGQRDERNQGQACLPDLT